MFYIATPIIMTPVYRSLLWPAFGYQNLVTIEGITASHANPLYPATNLANPQTSSLWMSGTTSVITLEFAVAGDDGVDYVGIARHNLGTGKVGIKIEGKPSAPGSVYQTLLELSPGDNRPIMGIFTEDTFAFIKITLTPLAAVQPFIGVVYIGKMLRMPTGIPPGHTPLPFAREIEYLSGVGENGDFLGDIITSQTLKSDMQFRLLDGLWYRDNMADFVQSRGAFFSAWAPLSFPTEVAFAKFDGNPKPVINQATGEIDITLPMRGLAL